MASDFTLGFYLRPAETNHAAGAQLWFVLGDSATRGSFLRAGVDFGAGDLRLGEDKTGLGAAVAQGTAGSAAIRSTGMSWSVSFIVQVGLVGYSFGACRVTMGT